jgi:CRISPR/Cas system-associated exonuclease Cas4 (RecB family)
MYKFGYIDRIPTTKPKEKMWFGNHLHESFKYILGDPYHLPTKADVIRDYAERFKKENFSTPGIAQNYFESGLKIVEEFYAKIKEKMPPVITTEEKFVLPLGKHQVSGVFDRVDKLSDTEFEIIDYKTGKVPDQRIVDKNLQLTMYDWAARQKWPGLTNIKLSLYFPAPDLKITTIRKPEDHQEMNEIINKTAEKIENGKFEPKPGPLCNYCDFQEFCPLMKEKFRTEKKDIDEIIKKYLELKNNSNQLKNEMELLNPHIHKYLDEEKVEKLFSEKGEISRGKTKRINVKIKQEK